MTSRRKSILETLNPFEGVNSLENFASSIKRAQSYVSIESDPTVERSYFIQDDQLVNDELQPSKHGERLSIVLEQGLLAQIRSELNETSALIDDDDIRQVKTHDKVVNIVSGRSTAPQTVFNSVNALIGIGLLALPLGLKLCGWVLGVFGLTLCAILTYYSAGLLSKCMDTDPTLMTYSDLGYATFGARGRGLISIAFSFELLAGGVSLIVLFADSLNALFPTISTIQFKLLAFVILTPSSFLSLNILSFISLLGIVSTISVVVIILISGLIHQESPGSLIHIAPTNLFPETVIGPLVSIGILMAPFGGHAIFPNLKADMRHPSKFTNTLSLTFIITYLTDITMAVIGFLMFGTTILDEVSKNVLVTKGYPSWTYFLISCLMAIVPFAKVPLNARPIITTIDSAIGANNAIVKVMVRLAVNGSFVVIGILYPSFDKIIAMVGSGLCILLCLILPCSFYLTICKASISPKEKAANCIIIVSGVMFSIVGTVAAIAY